MAPIAIQSDQIYKFTQLSPYYIITRFGRMSNHVTYYNLGMTACGTSRVTYDVSYSRRSYDKTK